MLVGEFLYEIFLCFPAVLKSLLAQGGFSSSSAPPQPWILLLVSVPGCSPLSVELLSEQLSSPAPAATAAAHSPERSGVAFKEIPERHGPAILIPVLTALVLK